MAKKEVITANGVQSTATEAPVKKKGNPVIIILLVIFGLTVICCSCAIGGFVALNYTIQNSAQATSVKSLFSALNENDKAKVKTLTSETLYTDLYLPMDDNSTLAGVIQGNIEKVTIKSFNVNNSDATVTFELSVKSKKEVFSKVTYAELSKVGETWIVTYFGPAPEDSLTPTPTSDGY